MNGRGAILAAALALAVACRAPAFAEGAAGTHEVEGDFLVGREGVLFAYAVDEGGFAAPLSGIREARLRVGPAEVAAGRAHFSFRLSAGIYCIRCFLDLNGNDRLDRGPFGPVEPWGMSWNGARRPGIPKFGDIAFAVDRDIRGLQIEVKR